MRKFPILSFPLLFLHLSKNQWMDACKAESKGYYGDGYTDNCSRPVGIALSNHMKDDICL